MASSACGNITVAIATRAHRRVGCYYALLASIDQTESHRRRPFIRKAIARGRKSSPSYGPMVSELHTARNRKRRPSPKNSRAPRERGLKVESTRGEGGEAAQQSSLYNFCLNQTRPRPLRREARASPQPEFVFPETPYPQLLPFFSSFFFPFSLPFPFFFFSFRHALTRPNALGNFTCTGTTFAIWTCVGGRL